MIFETKRLIIRDWLPEADVEYVFAIYNDPNVTRFIGGGLTDISQAESYLERFVELNAKRIDGSGFWAIIEKDTQELVGAVLLKRLPDKASNLTNDYEVGWHLRKLSWGKGYATEAGKGAIEYGFKKLQLPVIYAVANPENRASIRVMQRLGMIYMGRTNKYYGAEVELYKIEINRLL
jgi:[ribosomal protein S5]-alanine N-acetyltransferase